MKQRGFGGGGCYGGFRRIFVLLGVGLAASGGRDVSAAPAQVQEWYEMHCASCHGRDMAGGLGLSLVDGEWSGDGSDESIVLAISEGSPDMGMPGFGGVLDDEQIRSMVIYIREKEKEALRKASPPPEPEPGGLVDTEMVSYRVEEAVSGGLTHPWGMAFLPDGGMLVTERPGTLREVTADGGVVSDPIAGVPEAVEHGQGGMLEVALHPDHEENGWIYLGLSDGWKDGGGNPLVMTTIHRGRIRDGQWVDGEVIFKADRRFYTGKGPHFGTRIVFGHDGMLYFIIGERGEWHEVQKLTTPYGKVFRLHDDGRVPGDNPFVDVGDAFHGAWTYGHRNPQGMAVDVRDGSIYLTEHGPRGGDEFNHVRRGVNYGWPIITHGMNYNGTPITSETAKEGMAQPLLHWTPSIAPCGMAQYTGGAFPEWRHDFFAGSLRQEELHRIRVEGGRVVADEIVLKGLGRIRQVVDGPDGFLYVVTNKPDRILRIVPVGKSTD